ncbi:carboxymuconolactone decarboxylase family protein (plasmid) [Mycolicibacterium vanbaalenii]|uniref:carboxymuconolactone decarboxylase family protein n=1 Tax=Mycolicibacterium vanbaalenii TaxID=110539 RepID=UPI001F40A421|nr:carboxymuconolactone decarboxylase family protein [Mycolicibacterium vanbaalenii]UJL32164.1 carboxymuconolactone decarboxylase family protein [Mycolicibacterium vanbaalenii]WND60038.1 carboxymuconolactone decarboxylase family protein [Mycolicibacterium vanbaalenii]
MPHSERALTLPPRDVGDADPAIVALLTKARSKLGFVPNMYRNMANAPGLLETYMVGYDAFRGDSELSPAEQETVLLAISRTNGCEYCVAAHSTIADRSGVPAEVTDALREGHTIPDARLDALAAFTTTMVQSRGLPAAAELDAFFAAGFTESDVLQVLLAIAIKTISNYTNHLFHTEVDGAFASRLWEARS